MSLREPDPLAELQFGNLVALLSHSFPLPPQFSSGTPLAADDTGFKSIFSLCNLIS